MGVSPTTSDYMVMKSDGVSSRRTIGRLASDQAYDPAIFQDAKTRYRDSMIEGAWSTPVGVRFAVSTVVNQTQRRPPAVPWRARLSPGDFPLHGYTIGCPWCEQFQLNFDMRRNHSEACQARMEDPMAQTDDG